MTKEFLVAVDGTDQSKKALEYAIEVASAMDASITVSHAVHPSIYDDDTPISQQSQDYERELIQSVIDAEEKGWDILGECESIVEEEGVAADGELLYGNPVNEIVDFAERDDFDAIFVSHRGETVRSDYLVGSVAKSIMERSTIPVTVVR